MSSESFVTLATTDAYGLGALVLAQSIRQVGTKRNLVVLISKNLSDLIRKTLEQNFDEVILVEELNSNDEQHLKLLSRPELGITFTKINCWLLEKYTKCVFLDADCLVLRNIDDLFEREELSAAPDAGWPDCFNSGVFVYRPSKETFEKLMTFGSQENSTFDGGDQGLLNNYFSNWRSSDISRHLPFTYNVTANAFYSYLPAVTKYRHDIRIVHFAGSLKPWHLTYNPQNQQLLGNLSGQNDIQREFLASWWKTLYEHIWPQISKFSHQSNSTNMPFLTQQHPEESQLIGSLHYGNIVNNQGVETGSVAHRRAWETGQIDYLGRDSFSNIQQQLEQNIAQHTTSYHPSQQRKSPETIKSVDHSNGNHKQPHSILKHATKESTETTHKEPVSQQQPTKIASYETVVKETALPLNTEEQTKLKKDSFDQTRILNEKQPEDSSQLLSKQGTTTIQQSSTKQTITNVDEPIKETTSYPQQGTTTVHQTTTKQTIPIDEQKTTLLQSKQTSNIDDVSSKSTTLPHVKETTTIIKDAPPIQSIHQETTPKIIKETITVLKDINEPSISSDSTSILKSLTKDTTLPSVKETTTVLKTTPEFHLIHQDTTAPIVRETTTILKDTTKQSMINPPTKFESTEITQPIVRETTTVIRSSNDTTTPLIQQKITHLPDTIKQTISTLSFEENVSNRFQESLKGILPSTFTETTTFVKDPTKESTQQLLKETTSLLDKPQSTVGSPSEKESSWTVKSTMVSSYTKGTGDDVGPTVVSKTITESTATTTNILPSETSIQQTTGGTISSGDNGTVKSTNDYSPWLFDKIFVAITYTISLCYLMFLFILRRSKSSKISHGNLTSIQDTKSSTNTGKRTSK